jgi:putative ABC transport system substrate-binding protein
VLALLGGAMSASTAWPRAARAQQPALPVIGFLHSGTAAPYAARVAAFLAGLKDSGFVEGNNVAIEYRWAEGRYDLLPSMAAELVARNVSVIVAAGGVVSSPAAKAATKVIPIVFVNGADPVAAGLVTNLARPEGNMTGVSYLTQELGAKRLGLLHELAPAARVVAMLVNGNNPRVASSVGEVQTAARALGLQIQVIEARNKSDIDSAFAAISRQRPDALLLNPDPLFTSNASHIAALTTGQRLPAIFPASEYPENGGLMSYGANVRDQYRQVGTYVGRILKGAKPGDLPIAQPTTFELVLNLKTAKSFGFEIPPTLLARADEVIE